MSIAPDCTHILGGLYPLALTGRRYRSRHTANACPILAVTPATLTLCGFTLMMVFWSRCVSLKTGTGCDMPQSFDRETMPIPSHYVRVPGAGGDTGDPFFVRCYIDGGILVKVCFFQDGRRFRRAVDSFVLDHFRMLGPRSPRDPPLWEAHTILGSSTRLKVLGWVLDTNKLTISLPSRKSSKPRHVFTGWP